MRIVIKSSAKRVVWTGKVASKAAANRKTGELIASTGSSCTWLCDDAIHHPENDRVVDKSLAAALKLRRQLGIW